VILPTANVEDLMVREDIAEAVREGTFKVIAVEHADDLIQLMFNLPAGARGPDGKFPVGTLHAKVEAALKELNEKLDDRRKGEKDDKDEEQKHEPGQPPEPEPGPPEPPVGPPEPPPTPLPPEPTIQNPEE
jgi:hypothetical protein